METNNRQYDAFEELLAELIAEIVHDMAKIQPQDYEHN